jgi:hypothetical protein
MEADEIFMPDPWRTYNYEVMMFLGTAPPIQLPNPCPIDPQIYFNAFVESRLLHTRILCDILLSRGSQPDNITLDRLLPDFGSPLVDQLRKDYGDHKTSGTPCWELNKHLAHPTTLRADSHDYAPMLKCLEATMIRLFDEIAAEKKNRGI